MTLSYDPRLDPIVSIAKNPDVILNLMQFVLEGKYHKNYSKTIYAPVGVFRNFLNSHISLEEKYRLGKDYRPRFDIKMDNQRMFTIYLKDSSICKEPTFIKFRMMYDVFDMTTRLFRKQRKQCCLRGFSTSNNIRLCIERPPQKPNYKFCYIYNRPTICSFSVSKNLQRFVPDDYKPESLKRKKVEYVETIVKQQKKEFLANKRF